MLAEFTQQLHRLLIVQAEEDGENIAAIDLHIDAATTVAVTVSTLPVLARIETKINGNRLHVFGVPAFGQLTAQASRIAGDVADVTQRIGQAFARRRVLRVAGRDSSIRRRLPEHAPQKRRVPWGSWTISNQNCWSPCMARTKPSKVTGFVTYAFAPRS